MYIVFRETTHLVQDLTLGSEMLRDILYDMPFPLMQLKGYHQNEKTTDLVETKCGLSQSLVGKFFFEEMGKKEGALWYFRVRDTFLREIFC